MADDRIYALNQQLGENSRVLLNLIIKVLHLFYHFSSMICKFSSNLDLLEFYILTVFFYPLTYLLPEFGHRYLRGMMTLLGY